MTPASGLPPSPARVPGSRCSINRSRDRERRRGAGTPAVSRSRPTSQRTGRARGSRTPTSHARRADARFGMRSPPPTTPAVCAASPAPTLQEAHPWTTTTQGWSRPHSSSAARAGMRSRSAESCDSPAAATTRQRRTSGGSAKRTSGSATISVRAWRPCSFRSSPIMAGRPACLAQEARTVSLTASPCSTAHALTSPGLPSKSRQHRTIDTGTVNTLTPAPSLTTGFIPRDQISPPTAPTQA